MKKFFLVISCMLSIIWFMPMMANAYTAPDGNEYTYKVNANTGSQTNRSYTIYSNNKMCTVDNEIYYGGKYILGIFTNNESGQTVCTMTHNSGSTVTGVGTTKYPSGTTVNTSLDHGYRDFFEDTTTPSFGVFYLTDYNCINDTANLPNFSNLEDAYSYLISPDIDYDTVFYSPLIPNVDFSVVLNTSGVPVNDINSTEYNAFNVNINSDVGTDYNIQIGYKVHVPNKMALGVNDNGTAYYSALTYNNAVFDNVFSLQDNQVAFTGSVNSSLFEWTRQEVPSNDWNVVSSLQGNTAFINGSIMAYNDTMSYILPLYGKKLEIFMRYYVIQDNQIIVGAWSHWNNTYPSKYTQELPANYIPFHDVPGYQNTNNNTEYQENDNTVNSIGTSTGQNVTVYNNSVPNYPDYPTIVTYNHDNILLQTIETAKQLPQFFGDFSEFLASAFVFIPSEIWTIISFGFLCSIFVMIVKIL